MVGKPVRWRDPLHNNEIIHGLVLQWDVTGQYCDLIHAATRFPAYVTRRYRFLKSGVTEEADGSYRLPPLPKPSPGGSDYPTACKRMTRVGCQTQITDPARLPAFRALYDELMVGLRARNEVIQCGGSDSGVTLTKLGTGALIDLKLIARGSVRNGAFRATSRA